MKDTKFDDAVADNAALSLGAAAPARRLSNSGGKKSRKPSDKSPSTAKIAATGKAAVGKAPGSRAARTEARTSKTDVVLRKLRSTKGATITALTEATGWQAHSVRGFLSAVVRKKLGLALVSEVGKDGARRYRIADSAGEPAANSNRSV